MNLTPLAIQLVSLLYSIDQAIVRLTVQLMINWIVSFETFHYGYYASVQIKKKLDSLFSDNQI